MKANNNSVASSGANWWSVVYEIPLRVSHDGDFGGAVDARLGVRAICIYIDGNWRWPVQIRRENRTRSTSISEAREAGRILLDFCRFIREWGRKQKDFAVIWDWPVLPYLLRALVGRKKLRHDQQLGHAGHVKGVMTPPLIYYYRIGQQHKQNLWVRLNVSLSLHP